MRAAIVGLSAPSWAKVHTITSDSGRESAEHQAITHELKAGFYFTHSCATWERGLNENIDDLICQCFPKKMNFNNITLKQLIKAMKKLNLGPRKALDYRTTYEVFFNINVVLQN